MKNAKGLRNGKSPAPAGNIAAPGPGLTPIETTRDGLFRTGRDGVRQVLATGDRKVELQVSSIAVLGDFATWRAASASGEFDLRTFEVRARPSAPVTGLRPGMSALVPRQ